MQALSNNTIALVLNQLTNMFSESPTARLDAEVLTGFVCRLSREQLVTRDQSPVSATEYERLQQLAVRRQKGEPIAHITGQREFYSLTLSVTKDTLIPRPETELLVDLALREIPEDQCLRILELGTGTGAIALAIAKYRPRCKIIATDKSGKALQVARENAQNLSIENIEFQQGDWFEGLDLEPVDLILSNPPYIAENDSHLKQGDVRFEPAPALVAGADGLDDIKKIVRHARSYLLPGGKLMLEHGAQQAKDTSLIFSEAGANSIACFRDLAGLERVSVCTF